MHWSIVRWRFEFLTVFAISSQWLAQNVREPSSVCAKRIELPHFALAGWTTSCWSIFHISFAATVFLLRCAVHWPMNRTYIVVCQSDLIFRRLDSEKEVHLPGYPTRMVAVETQHFRPCTCLWWWVWLFSLQKAFFSPSVWLFQGLPTAEAWTWSGWCKWLKLSRNGIFEMYKESSSYLICMVVERREDAVEMFWYFQMESEALARLKGMLLIGLLGNAQIMSETVIHARMLSNWTTCHIYTSSVPSLMANTIPSDPGWIFVFVSTRTRRGPSSSLINTSRVLSCSLEVFRSVHDNEYQYPLLIIED